MKTRRDPVTARPLLRTYTVPVMPGNLDVQVPEPTDSETGTLARGFHEMIQRIGSSKSEVRSMLP